MRSGCSATSIRRAMSCRRRFFACAGRTASASAKHVAPWLFTVCRNLALDARKHASRSAPLEQVEVAVACDLDEQHDARQALGQVLDVLETLPRNQREVVYLRFQGGLSYREVGAITGLSVSNVGFLLHTAVRAIRNHLRAETSGAGHDYSSNRL